MPDSLGCTGLSGESNKIVKSAEMGLELELGLPFRFKENFFGLSEDFEDSGDTPGGLASPLFWVELVATVARDDGMLEVLLWVLLSGEMRTRGVE